MRFWRADEEKITEEVEKAWLYRVCRNMAIDHRRRQNVVIAVGDATELDSFNTLSDSPSSEGESDEFAQVLVHLQNLTPNQQEVIRLRYQHDLSYKEIAKVTGHSVSNVGVLIHEAMRKLKKLLTAGADSPSEEGAV